MSKHSKSGFTLIELLIVMAIIAILAVGLIAALDPLEQIRKGTDTGVRSTATEFKKAVERYYAATQRMPWCPATGACTDPTTGNTLSPGANVTLNTLNLGTYNNAVTNLMNSGELKSNFTTSAANQLGLIYITGSSTTGNVVVCFKPTSKSFQEDGVNTVNFASGQPTTGCKSQQTAGGTDCYWCIQ